MSRRARSLALFAACLLFPVAPAGVARASFPPLVDLWLQMAKLTASDGATSDFFGFTVAVSGDTVVIGAYQADLTPGGNEGAVYVFVKPAGGWATTTTFDAKLTASDGAADDFFGNSAAVSGDTVVVGARGADIGANGNQGAAYVFVKPAGGWATTAAFDGKLTASDGADGDAFGRSVAISGDTVVVGADFDDFGVSNNQGSAYVFVQPGGGWTNLTQTGKLTASDGAGGDQFGQSVAVDGDTVAVGAHMADIEFGDPNDPFSNVNQGAAYVFVKPVSGWMAMTETGKLTASDGTLADQFAFSVAVSGDTVVVGSRGADLTLNGNQGAAYVFVKPGGGWASTSAFDAKLTASDAVVNDTFGYSAAISGDTVVVGAYVADLTPSGNQGASYLFVKPGGGWASTSAFDAKLTASDAATNDQFGYSVAISGATVAVGADEDNIGSNSDQGSAYVFGLDASSLTPTVSPTATPSATLTPPATSSATTTPTATPTGPPPATPSATTTPTGTSSATTTPTGTSSATTSPPATPSATSTPPDLPSATSTPTATATHVAQVPGPGADGMSLAVLLLLGLTPLRRRRSRAS